MEIVRDKSAEKLARQFLEKALRAGNNGPILFLSSGGSVLDILDGLDKNIFSPNFTIGVLDERFSADPKVNNFLQLKERLGGITNVSWINSVPLEGDTPQTLAKRIEDSWRKWRSNNLTGKIIITAGTGVDGHTASIFPRQKSSTSDVDDFRWVVGHDVGEASKHPLRITATFEFLRNEVNFAIVYISGEEKRPVLDKVLADSGTIAETPARIFREMKNVTIFTDIL